jgi:hypothetical protein
MPRPFDSITDVHWLLAMTRLVENAGGTRHPSSTPADYTNFIIGRAFARLANPPHRLWCFGLRRI